MLVETVVAATVPAAIEGIKQVITRFTGGVRPTSVDEQIKLQEADVKRLEALARLDTPIGEPTQWVVDLRASSRYVGALVVISGGLLTLFIPTLDLAIKEIAMEAASVCFGFLFGQRVILNIKGK